MNWTKVMPTAVYTKVDWFPPLAQMYNVINENVIRLIKKEFSQIERYCFLYTSSIAVLLRSVNAAAMFIATVPTLGY